MPTPSIGNQGVMIPSGQMRRTGGTPKTVLNVVECQMVAVEYVNAQGETVTEVMLKAGDTLYQPPNAEQWTSALRPLSTWLTKGIQSKLRVKDPVIAAPTEDAVDVVAADMAR